MIDPTNPCKWCNSGEHEDWSHMLFRCEYLNEIRPKMEYNVKQLTASQLVQKIDSMSCNNVRELYTFLFKTIRLRKQWMYTTN